MGEILVLYYSRGGSVARLARQIARGIGEVPGMVARLRTVPPVAAVTQTAQPPVPDDGAPYVSVQDLADCQGLLLGSPTRFGNMAAPVKHFLDGLGAEWVNGTLAGKPAGVLGAGMDMVRGWRAKGFRCLCYGSDVSVFQSALKGALDTLKGEAG
jgi:NAD(P)H dehydrogenase (quinone)